MQCDYCEKEKNQQYAENKPFTFRAMFTILFPTILANNQNKIIEQTDKHTGRQAGTYNFEKLMLSPTLFSI